MDERIEEHLIGTLSRLENEPICFGIGCMYSYQPRNGFRETLEKIKHFYKNYPKLNTRIYQYYAIAGRPLYDMEKEQGLINEPKTLCLATRNCFSL